MVRAEVKNLLRVITKTYSNFKPNDPESVLDVWTTLLSGEEYETVAKCFMLYALNDTSGFAPTVAQILSNKGKLSNSRQFTESEAREIILNALEFTKHYGAVERVHAGLPALIKRVCGVQRFKILKNLYEDESKSNFVFELNSIMKCFSSERDEQACKQNLQQQLNSNVAIELNRNLQISASDTELVAPDQERSIMVQSEFIPPVDAETRKKMLSAEYPRECYINSLLAEYPTELKLDSMESIKEFQIKIAWIERDIKTYLKKYEDAEVEQKLEKLKRRSEVITNRGKLVLLKNGVITYSQGNGFSEIESVRPEYRMNFEQYMTYLKEDELECEDIKSAPCYAKEFDKDLYMKRLIECEAEFDDELSIRLYGMPIHELENAIDDVDSFLKVEVYK